MDAQTLMALRDPAGLPFFPEVFMGLGVLTFALHIFAVQLMLGASGLAVYGAFTPNPHGRRLGLAMLDVAKVSVSVAIVIGVAPLLFVQVIYDPFWYTANVLSARWVMAFILILIVAYLAMYLFYFRNTQGDAQAPRRSAWAIVVSVVLLLVVGSIMHVLTREMLFPEDWKGWYAPDGVIDASGDNYKAFAPFRFAFFIAMALPVTGAWLIAMRHYFAVRPNRYPATYLDFAGRLGRTMMLGGTALVILLGIGWMATLPEKVAGFGASVWVWPPLLGLLLAGGMALKPPARDSAGSYLGLVVLLVAGLLVAISREALRYAILVGEHGYQVFDYPLNMDWYSTVLFFATFAIVGGLTLTYLIAVVWNAGRTEGVYTPGPVVDRLGTLSIGAILVWILQFFAIGFYVWMQ
ncbi:hypothetical protein [Roseospira navarrensis]|uniref:Uncharacterized protein n=1 Tax=Roseospira navarrensis TaxID=140058 RepID=A0A7X1ZG90_9PROT|nr:hypothetical protein [Roseospira navarrensis]MQX37797.1 hypothetical protein [Roseospira navarrensis]